MGNEIQEYRVYNPKNVKCPTSTVLNTIYNADGFQKELELPEEAGKGYYRKIAVNPFMEIYISDMTFHEELTLVNDSDKPQYCLAFCLEEELRWKVEGDQKHYEIVGGESYIFNGIQGKSRCHYKPGQRFFGVSIHLNSNMINDLVDHGKKQSSLEKFAYGSNFFYKSTFSSSMKRILYEMIYCRYRNQVKKLYLEGKILELIAIYMEELCMEEKERLFSLKLTSADIQSLYQAKKILDEHMIAPPTIEQLARQVCLNEFKLKKGFKELFGMPVHAYVIDRRLEKARLLLKNKNLKVIDVAVMVGYGDASHFAEKFRKKFGVTPSQYMKETRTISF